MRSVGSNVDQESVGYQVGVFGIWYLIWSVPWGKRSGSEEGTNGSRCESEKEIKQSRFEALVPAVTLSLCSV